MRPVLAQVTRAEEEASMRACAAGDVPCFRGARCYGAQLARGYVLPRFRAFLQCVVCLRAETTARWLAGLGDFCAEVLPPYRVVIGPGEYARDATLQPCGPRFDGVTDPYVAYSPEKLEWRGETLSQELLVYALTPSLRHEARPRPELFLKNGLVDIWAPFLRAGLFDARDPDATGIALVLQRALWAREVSMESSWVRACLRFYFDCEDEALALLAVRLRVLDHARANPVLEAELEKRHGAAWRAFGEDTHAWALRMRADRGLAAECARALRRAPALVAVQESFEARAARLAVRARVAATSPVARQRHEAGVPDKALVGLVGRDAAAGVRLVPAPTHWPAVADAQYACVACREFKGADAQYARARDSKRKALKFLDGAHMMYGQRGIGFSLETGELTCRRKLGKGQGAHAICGAAVTRFFIGANVVELFGTTVMACTRCGLLCPRTEVVNAFVCGRCTPAPKPACAICLETRGDLAAVNVFENNAALGLQKLWLCKKHRPTFIAEFKLWAKPLLMLRLRADDRERAHRRYAAAVRR